MITRVEQPRRRPKREYKEIITNNLIVQQTFLAELCVVIPGQTLRNLIAMAMPSSL